VKGELAMRMPFIAGNWKMNTNKQEAEQLAKKIISVANEFERVDVVIAPPFVHLNTVAGLIVGSRLKLAAQNMCWEDKGAFTGEISPLMLTELGCSYVIIGHSERRIHFLENDEMINKKIKAAFKNNLIPILCVGETLPQRREGKAWEVISNQISEGLKGLDEAQLAKMIIAYEPVWAIGTGIAAEVKDAVEIHDRIREYFDKVLRLSSGDVIRILYGGSVTSSNIKGFISEETIDGALVGGASLKFEEFSAIIKASYLKFR